MSKVERLVLNGKRELRGERRHRISFSDCLYDTLRHACLVGIQREWHRHLKSGSRKKISRTTFMLPSSQPEAASQNQSLRQIQGKFLVIYFVFLLPTSYRQRRWRPKLDHTCYVLHQNARGLRLQRAYEESFAKGNSAFVVNSNLSGQNPDTDSGPSRFDGQLSSSSLSKTNATETWTYQHPQSYSNIFGGKRAKLGVYER